MFFLVAFIFLKSKSRTLETFLHMILRYGIFIIFSSYSGELYLFLFFKSVQGIIKAKKYFRISWGKSILECVAEFPLIYLFVEQFSRKFSCKSKYPNGIDNGRLPGSIRKQTREGKIKGAKKATAGSRYHPKLERSKGLSSNQHSKNCSYGREAF